MVEEPFPGHEGRCERHHLGMAGRAQMIALLRGHGLGSYYLKLRERLSLRSFLRDQNMLLRGAVACLAVDAGLGPGCMIGLCCRIIVAPDLAHMAVVARGVERIRALSPVNRRIRPPLPRKMSKPAPGRIEPFFLLYVIRHREGLEPSLVEQREEVIDILPAGHMLDPISLRPFRSNLRNIAGLRPDLSAVSIFSDDDVFFLGQEFLLCKCRCISLHRKPVPRRCPELIKLLVALPAGRGAGVAGGLLLCGAQEFRVNCESEAYNQKYS